MKQAITLTCRHFFTVFIRTDYCGLSKDTCNGLNNNNKKKNIKKYLSNAVH